MTNEHTGEGGGSDPSRSLTKCAAKKRELSD